MSQKGALFLVAFAFQHLLRSVRRIGSFFLTFLLVATAANFYMSSTLKTTKLWWFTAEIPAVLEKIKADHDVKVPSMSTYWIFVSPINYYLERDFVNVVCAPKQYQNCDQLDTTCNYILANPECWRKVPACYKRQMEISGGTFILFKRQN